ncbi:hypothetical protein Riv7116_1127 [Rivularia sp. PCC 7116]|nr:hypothetical protein Riv7116_1127 [Rivularia sp. PCC 7116]
MKILNLINYHQKVNNFGDTLLSEDFTISNNLYPIFNQKNAFKNDTPMELAMNYFKHWGC